MNKNSLYYLAFSHFSGIGSVKIKKLMDFYEDVKKAYKAPLSELRPLLGTMTSKRFGDFREKFDPIVELEYMHKKEIYLLTREDNLFPPQLLQIPDPPLCIYVKGDLKTIDFKENTFISIVGTRQFTGYGKYLTRKFSFELTKAGCVIVSGMALGVDGLAHETAIEAGGKTVAFLGCGVDIIYPYQHKKLYKSIIEGNGLVISEFPPGMRVDKGLFISRNRLISGLSKGVLVIEGAKDSGSLVTAHCALEQGKEVFAPPAPLTSRYSEAPNKLLKDGAKLVTSVNDILDEFHMKVVDRQSVNFKNFKDEEKFIIEKLKDEEQSVDSLVAYLRIPVHKALSILTILEMRRVVEKNNQGKYQLR